ncbi:DUF1573 domain-containing protein [Flammeovirga pacifica]|uniref:DUF1573 domain-containing protein n=1 Tax=Flammeovirga pacifica TaxID=915059 RepID=A0A1S1Z0N4_FLAPC|nr:DUF1573 domain-containing protein [Flammeovirga pacifica]OHX66829.1 hypothetical protein NH26_10910 [Flammeovirga pacifica]
MIKNLFVTLLLICGLTLSSNAQYIHFDADSVFLGKLSYTEDTIEHTFPFKVDGASSIQIDTVITDCGCLIPTYPTNEIKKGQKGEIKISFMPYKAGPFSKEVTIKFKSRKITQTVKLAGFIRPYKLSAKQLYPYENGGIRWGHKKVSFGNLTAQGITSKTVYFYNDTEDTLFFEKPSLLPDHLGILIDSTRYSVKPKSEGSFELFIKPEDRIEFGYAQDTINLLLSKGTKEEVTSEFIVSASIHYPESQGDGPKPKMNLSSTYINLGNVKNDGLKIISLSVMNTGEIPLKILKVEANHGLELLSVEDEDIQPLESSNINLRFLETARTGKEIRSFTLFTNDPTDPVTIISVKANVVK